MPIYEYRCEVCGANEERLQPISAAAEHDCSACNAPTAMKRQISRTAFTLSGGGWYASGYGDGNPGQGAATSLPSSPADSVPAESKPAGGCATGCASHSPAAPKATENG